MLRRAFVLLAATLALAGCVGVGAARRYGAAPRRRRSAAGAPGGGGRPVAILLPLTGAHADLGQSMLQAAQLALAAPGAPALDVRDTGGTPRGRRLRGARGARRRAPALILGPLTSTETAAVAPLARAAGVPVLAFTNDPAQAQPGVWPLGITPVQQVRRLVAAAQAQGKSRFAGLLPDDRFRPRHGQRADPGRSRRRMPHYYGGG